MLLFICTTTCQITLWLNSSGGFQFNVFRKLFCYETVTWSYAVQVLTIWNVCFWFLRSQPEIVCAVWSDNNTSPRCRRSLAFVFVFWFLADYEGWIFTQFVVYGDGSLYSYRTICWNIWYGFKTIFSVFSSQYIVKWCMLCSTNVFYQIIKMGMYYRKFWSVCFWIKQTLFILVSKLFHQLWVTKWWRKVRQPGMFLQVHNNKLILKATITHTVTQWKHNTVVLFMS